MHLTLSLTYSQADHADGMMVFVYLDLIWMSPFMKFAFFVKSGETKSTKDSSLTLTS